MVRATIRSISGSGGNIRPVLRPKPLTHGPLRTERFGRWIRHAGRDARGHVRTAPQGSSGLERRRGSCRARLQGRGRHPVQTGGCWPFASSSVHRKWGEAGHYSTSLLGRAQAECFAVPPDGLGTHHRPGRTQDRVVRLWRASRQGSSQGSASSDWQAREPEEPTAQVDLHSLLTAAVGSTPL
jgi:hypothetical protein